MTQLPHTRPATGWLRLHVRENTFNAYDTSNAVADEVWLLLHQYAEVGDRGRAFVKAFQPTLDVGQTDAVWREFRAYVRQAEAFYRAAVPLPWKSAPLNLYYAFLNLAKAALVVRGLLPAEKIRHGLSSRYPSPQTTVTDWKVEVRDGVFPLLYWQRGKQSIPSGQVLCIGQLLAYSWPIGLQYTESGFGNPRLSPGFCLNLTDASNGWTLIAIHKSLNITGHPLLGPTLNQVYREVQPPKRLAREALDFHAVATDEFQFFETITMVARGPQGEMRTSELLAPLYQALPDAVEPPVLSTNHQFVLSIPYDTGSGFMPISELLATYAVIFFLSELVRYYPERLDHISETRDGWVLESFVTSCPTQMTRLMLNAILGRTIVLNRG